MNFIGINPGHNASIALSVNDEVKFAISEERLVRKKNYFGIPFESLKYVYSNFCKKEEVDCFGIYHNSYREFTRIENLGKEKDLDEYERWKGYVLKKLFLNSIFSGLFRSYERVKFDQEKMRRFYSEKLHVPVEKIHLINHHLCHAESAIFSLDRSMKWLVLTCDGEGDNECASVYLNDGNNITKLTGIDRDNSLGYLFYFVTQYLGMTPNAHEFKVMGLEPYARKNTKEFERVFKKFSDIFYFEGNDFRCSVPMMTNRQFQHWLILKMKYERFDYIAAAAQKILEEVILKWVMNWVKQSGISNIAIAGGVFMNVKVNQKLYESKEISNIYIVPSAGDETTTLGACNFLNLQFQKCQLKPLENLYLGNEHSDEKIKDFVENKLDKNKYTATFYGEELESVVAGLLSKGVIVARFNGRSEFGARALGNRSILAHPSNRLTIRTINELIKDRDFWMPFTPSVLEEDADLYIQNPRQLFAPYMAITFNSTELGKSQLSAAIHPYDETMRIQMVRKDWNPTYHKLISKFKELTGIGGILNTSFNLHGEPNVNKPEDCIHTLDKSGLTHLSIGRHLIVKEV
jgi:carbamoyltransferase